MPTAISTRQDAIARAAVVFREHGYEGASLSLLSQATGLGRASLYHHFPGGKDEIGRAVVRSIVIRTRAELIETLRGEGSPPERLEEWVRGALRLYDGGRLNCVLSVMTLSGGHERYADELKRSVRTLVSALARPLRDAGLPTAEARRRAEHGVATLQGALIASRAVGEPAVFRRIVRRLPAILLADLS